MSSRDFHWRFFSRSATERRGRGGKNRPQGRVADVLGGRGQLLGAWLANGVHFKVEKRVSRLTNELEHLGVVLLECHVAGLRREMEGGANRNAAQRDTQPQRRIPVNEREGGG